MDGCFFKGACNGELICAVDRDANNQIYLVSWAVIKKETEDSWTWFLGLLQKDLRPRMRGGRGGVDRRRQRRQQKERSFWQLGSGGIGRGLNEPKLVCHVGPATCAQQLAKQPSSQENQIRRGLKVNSAPVCKTVEGK